MLGAIERHGKKTPPSHTLVLRGGGGACSLQASLAKAFSAGAWFPTKKQQVESESSIDGFFLLKRLGTLRPPVIDDMFLAWLWLGEGPPSPRSSLQSAEVTFGSREVDKMKDLGAVKGVRLRVPSFHGSVMAPPVRPFAIDDPGTMEVDGIPLQTGSELQ